MKIKATRDDKKKYISVRTDLSTLKTIWDKPEEFFKDKNNLAVVRENRGDTSSDVSFRGGKFADTFTVPDMAAFIKEKANLDKSFSTLITKFASQPKRKRVMSEYDGEWQMHRQWEITPFASAARLPTLLPCLEIRCEFNFNASVDSSEINTYGTIAWSIVSLLESIGVSVKLSISNPGEQSAFTSDSTVFFSSDTIIDIKNFGEYVAPSELAKVFKSNFFRRAMFTHIVVGAEANGLRVSSSLGSARSYSKYVEYKNGVLYLRGNNMKGLAAAVEKEVLALFKRGRNV